MRIRRASRATGKAAGELLTFVQGPSVSWHIEGAPTPDSLQIGRLGAIYGEARQAAATNAASHIQSVSGLHPPRSAHEWVQAHPHDVLQHKGEWLAVTKDGIVATSLLGMDDIFKRAYKRGVRDPMVFKVPKDTTRKRVVSIRR